MANWAVLPEGPSPKPPTPSDSRSRLVPMLVAEELLLCLTNPVTGRHLVSASELDIAVGGGLLLELALRERVDVAGPQDAVRRGSLVVRDPTPTGDPVLDLALSNVLGRVGRKPPGVVSALGKGQRHALYRRLAEAGILRAEDSTVLGIFHSRRWPAADRTHVQDLRGRLAVALQAGATTDTRLAALVSLLLALDAVHKVVFPPGVGLDKRALKARATRIAEGEWAGRAVKDAIAGVNAAVSAAAMATIIAGGSSGS